MSHSLGTLVIKWWPLSSEQCFKVVSVARRAKNKFAECASLDGADKGEASSSTVPLPVRCDDSLSWGLCTTALSSSHFCW
jgi:hypothetical protein